MAYRPHSFGGERLHRSTLRWPQRGAGGAAARRGLWAMADHEMLLWRNTGLIGQLSWVCYNYTYIHTYKSSLIFSGPLFFGPASPAGPPSHSVHLWTFFRNGSVSLVLLQKNTHYVWFTCWCRILSLFLRGGTPKTKYNQRTRSSPFTLPLLPSVLGRYGLASRGFCYITFC